MFYFLSIFKQKLPFFLIKKRYYLPVFVIISFLMYDLIFPFQPQIEYGKIILDREGKLLTAFQTTDEKWRFKTELNDVSPTVYNAFIQKEDRFFYYHFGINPLALTRAFISNITKQKRVSGASTITMQVVRLLQKNERNYANKIMETIHALQLELHYTKTQILEMYLSLVPFGSNIEGVSAASLIYFKKSAQNLSLSQAISLSIIPNRPAFLLIKNQQKFLAYKSYWLEKYKKDKTYSTLQIQEAKQEQVIFKKYILPKKAIHFAEMIKTSLSENESKFISSLKLTWQNQVENQLKQHVARFANNGLQNGMVLVVDNATKEVLVYCGSANYENNEDAGQVNGIQAVRSPGSTLKPFLYGLAMEKGFVNPKTVLYDIPSSFAGYMPINFDNTFTGKISMAEALQNSLNIPAVKTLDQIGVKPFVNFLKKLHFKNIETNEEKLGLSVILGGCGVSMEELVCAYSSLANYGNYQPISYKKATQPTVKNTIVLDSATCYILANILSGMQRPDLPNNFEFTYKLPKIAWKTGTSFGKRDAWAIGYNPQYTVGVWLGNFSGEGMPNISGAAVATPLLFQIFNTISTEKKWFQMPKSYMYRQVCSITGLSKSAECPTVELDAFVDKSLPKTKCNHYKKVWVNQAETISYCTKCINHADAKQYSILNEPAAFTLFMNQKGIYSQSIPVHNPNCQSISYNNTLKITTPTANGVYYVESQKNQTIKCEAEVDNSTKWLYWYHNGNFLGQFNIANPPFIKPTVGNNIISCTNPFGKSTKISFEVKPI